MLRRLKPLCSMLNAARFILVATFCLGMVLDSSFSSLLTLAEEMVDKGRQQGLYSTVCAYCA